MAIKHILSTGQFIEGEGREFLKNTLSLADHFRNQKGATSKEQANFVDDEVVNLFYEPSTRTRFSFERAEKKLGLGKLSSEHGAIFSSAAKGESPEDTVRNLCEYDIAGIIIRHPVRGTAAKVAEVSSVPIINAGDGDGEHPTQTLLDLYTIQRELGRLDDFTIGFVNDLRFSRTIHSLIKPLALSKNVRVLGACPKETGMTYENICFMADHGIPYEETENLEEILPKVDILYMTRLQTERFDRDSDTQQKLTQMIMGNRYVINEATLLKLKSHMAIMHPLPRNNEIAPEVDKDPRAAYFRQTGNGLWIRMAILYLLLTTRHHV